MRLFISINCNEEAKDDLFSVQEKIKSQTTNGNFTRPDNLHLTLIFLGENAEAAVPVISSIIKNTIQEQISFDLIFSKVSCFKHFNRELWWIGVEPSDPYFNNLKDIRQKIASGLSRENITFDNKQFKAHITLGREIKHDIPIKTPDQNINFPVRRISLMKSERINGVLKYLEIFGIDLM